MCGLAGLIWRQSPYNEEVLESLRDALAHRGPDDNGVVTFQSISLVHTRLSIIDVGGGHQPLEDKENRTLLVGNGEIYNYVELKQDYAQYPYACQSDMEVIFPLYREHGVSFARSLRGMFALALYDEREERLILARDPYGIKPLYYVDTPSYFAFSSEIQAFVKARLVHPALNIPTRDELLQLRYNTGAETTFEGVKRLLPGETMVLEKGIIKERFIHDCLPKKFSKVTQDKALQDFDRALSDSVKVHLRSDVPYGLFLSGGLDSAAILKLMERHTSQPIQTFTIGFDQTSVHDERLPASQMAAAVGANHRELYFTEADFWEILPKVVTIMDDLIFDQAMLPTYKLAQEAAKHVKVVLCGEGGDEMLAGYRRYQKARLPLLLGGRLSRQKGVFHEWKNLFTHDFSQWRRSLDALQKQETLSSRTRVQIAQAIDCRSWLANNLLVKLDRCLMAHGIEGRTPFLDPVVTEATFDLSDDLKIKRGYGKWLLRQWLAKNFPEAQPFEKKRGFRVPVGAWLLSQKERLVFLLPRQEGLRQICDQDYFHGFLKTFTEKDEFAIWTLLVYALWYKHYYQGVSLQGGTFDCLER